MGSDTILALVERVNVWRRRGDRAPHKPLLLLLALGRLSHGQTDLPYAECEAKLSELLREFGPSRRSLHPEYPFWRLQQDGLWDVSADGSMRSRQSNTDPTRRALREKRAVGRFPKEVQLELQGNPARIAEAARSLLAAHFPQSLHQDILDSVGLSLDQGTATPVARDPGFRQRVLVAYEYRCAVCDLDIRIGNVTVALEAAHVQWHQAGGPDTVNNGLALCSLHHKLFDLGAFTIHMDHRVLVSELVHGSGRFKEVLLRHHGQKISGPCRADHAPGPPFLQWHRREVFKEGARFLEGLA